MPTRKSNPVTGTIVAGGFIVAALGLAGWLGYKLYKSSNPLSSLPTFDPASTDVAHVYLIAVFTSSPVTDAQMPAPHAVVRDYLATLPVTKLLVMGPVAEGDVKPPALDPMPDLVLATSLAGNVLEAMSRGQIEAIKKAFTGV